MQALMDFMNETRREQNEKFDKHKEEVSENLRIISENFTEIRREQKEKFDEIRREQAENNKVISEKLDKHKEEVCLLYTSRCV